MVDIWKKVFNIIYNIWQVFGIVSPSSFRECLNFKFWENLECNIDSGNRFVYRCQWNKSEEGGGLAYYKFADYSGQDDQGEWILFFPNVSWRIFCVLLARVVSTVDEDNLITPTPCLCRARTPRLCCFVICPVACPPGRDPNQVNLIEANTLAMLIFRSCPPPLSPSISVSILANLLGVSLLCPRKLILTSQHACQTHKQRNKVGRRLETKLGRKLHKNNWKWEYVAGRLIIKCHEAKIIIERERHSRGEYSYRLRETP